MVGCEASADAHFGQTDFGHPYVTDFGQSDFGQTDFGPKNGVFVFWPNHPSTRRRAAGDPFEPASRRVGPKSVGPLKVEALKGGRPKISRFFCSPATIFFLSSLSWRSFRGILVVFEAPGP